jgi:hypothetical protein
MIMKNLQFRLTGILLLVSGLAISPFALAQKISVSAANPASAVQGTLNLDVEISGNGFDDTVDEVEFLLPCSMEPCTNNGNVIVKHFKVNSRKKIVANIDVLDIAVIADYDISVRSTSRGRGGKGTTLFSVQSKDSGGGATESTLTANFCLIMTAENPGLASDGQLASNPIHDYCDDRKERVQIGTGSFPGFRFDSNTKSRPPLRWVEVNFPSGLATALDDDGASLTTFYSDDYQLDLRFNKNNGGLDLGSMLFDGDPGAPLGGYYFVPVNLHFHSLDGMSHFKLAFSEDTDPLSSSGLIGNTCVRDNTLDARVKRLAAGRWSIESNPLNDTACLWDMNFDSNVGFENQLTGTPVDLPFYFEIEIK